MRRLLSLLLGFGLLAAACSSAESDAESDADSTNGAEESPADGQSDAVSDGSDEEVAVDFDYSGVDYDVEPVGNALFGDRYNSAFPPPVVPIEEIRSGGPPPDGITPVDVPIFIPIEEVTFMEAEEEAIIAVTVDGVTKGYPIRVMTLHEIVNDVFVGTSGEEIPVTVTYCPLCNSALAYDRRFGDRVLDFGTSGELYQSAMVMYDRQTQSLWSHFLGQGIVGHYAGAQLDFFPAQTLGWAAFTAFFPDAMVLDQNSTGMDRRYGSNPYVGYDDVASFPMFVTSSIDGRMAPKQRVLGIRDAGASLAISLFDLEAEEVISVTDNGWNLAVFHQAGLTSALETFSVSEGADVGQTGVFDAIAADGTSLTFTATDAGFVDNETGSTWSITGAAIDGPLVGEQLVPFGHLDTFWFAWSIYQPDTQVWEG